MAGVRDRRSGRGVQAVADRPREGQEPIRGCRQHGVGRRVAAHPPGFMVPTLPFCRGHWGSQSQTLAPMPVSILRPETNFRPRSKGEALPGRLGQEREPLDKPAPERLGAAVVAGGRGRESGSCARPPWRRWPARAPGGRPSGRPPSGRPPAGIDRLREAADAGGPRTGEASWLAGLRAWRARRRCSR